MHRTATRLTDASEQQGGHIQENSGVCVPPAFPRPRECLMQKPRTTPLAIAAISLVLVVVSCVLMARRIVAYNAEQGRVTYLQLEIITPEFNFAGRRVALADIPPSTPDNLGSVSVSFGDDTLTLPVTIPPNEYAEQFPGLERYGDWLRVVRFAPLTGRGTQQLIAAMEAGEEPDRLVLVTRTSRPGVNPNTWGRVWRKDWSFDFYEFLPGGGFHHERFAYPSVRSASQQQQHRDEVAEGHGGLPELDTRSWQFQVADLLMPEGSAPRIIAGDSPLVAAGWTFPAAVFAVFGATAGILLAFAPGRTHNPTREHAFT